jgi:NTP pyrophosphatase (non-canonical NTP hydrolase)
MTIDDFQKLTTLTEAPVTPELRVRCAAVARLLHGGIGISTEIGEFMDVLKRYIFYGKAIDHVNLVEELGDLVFYISVLANALGVSLEEIMQANIDKLRARYPNKFSEHDAVVRDLEVERSVLESRLG